MFALEIINEVFEASKHRSPTKKDLNALRVAVLLAEKERRTASCHTSATGF